jgi:glycosyltransferase involved in cell wall biosynthesis
MPRYTIITPTVLRPSLIRTCESVNKQTCTDWEHIVMVDREGDVPEEIIHPQRKILYCPVTHNNYGNTCRWSAYEHATGDYLYYLDDDNYFMDDTVLETLKIVTGDWAIFPIFKPTAGGMHLFCPPLRGLSDGGSMTVKREFGRWLNLPTLDDTGKSINYDADGQLIDLLRASHPYQTIFCRPLMFYGGVPKNESGEQISL